MTRSIRLCSTLLLAAATGGVAANAPSPAPEAFAAALELALADPAAAADSRLFVECVRDGRLPSVELFGRGLGVWDGRRQFAFPPPRHRDLLRAARDAGFAAMPATYGGVSTPGDAASPVGEAAALKVICRVRLALGPLVKEVAQLEKGEQSAALRALADAVYALAAPAAEVGIDAASLEDGLDRVARGELAPETLRLVLHRKPELHVADAGRDGFLLRIDGREVALQPFAVGAGYGAERRLRLNDAELASLAGALAALRPGRFPANLWANDYVDFELAVLDRRVAVQARRFSGTTATTHGEAQRAFDAALAPLVELAARAARDGAEVAEVVDR